MKLHRETKIGIIAAIIIVCFIWGFNFLKSKNILTTNDSFYALYSNIDGMEEGSPVIINGFKIGVVESIKLHETKRDIVIVRFMLKEDLKLPLNTEAIIYPASLIAGKAIKLKFSDSKEFHANHDTLIGVLEQDLISNLSDELMPLKNKIEKLVVSMDSVLSIFDDKRKEDIRSSLDNLENITNELSSSLEKGKLAKIISNVESISNNLKNNNEQITNILTNFSNISDSIQKADIKTTIVNANKTLAEFSEISTKINNGEGTIGMLINNDSLYLNLNNLAADLDSFIIDLNKNPKRYVHFSLFGKKDKK